MKPIFILLLSLCPAVLPAQNRTDHAVFFVASKFDYGWQTLSDAPGEVTAIAAQLETNYGFKVKIVSNATRADIIKTLGEYKTKPYGPKDQLLLFFSMHGVHDKGSDKGYLIPKDGLSDDPTYDTWFSHSQLAEITQSMPCNRVLVALDACYSGIFGKHRDDNRPTPAWERPEYLCQERLLKAFNSNQTRKYLTAGGDVRVPAKSAYAAQWIAALKAGGGGDGLLGFHELLGYVDQFQEPRPAWGDFVPGTSGDFVFVKKDGCATPAPPTPGAETETPEKRLFREVAEWQKADALKTLVAYQDYRSHWCPGGTFCEAADAKIDAIKNTEKTAKAAGVTQKQVEKPDDDFVLVQGGTFQMGSPENEADRGNDEKQHSVTLSNFYISKWEVTQAEWRKVMGADPPELGFPGCDQCPVERVSWNDVQDFLVKINQQNPGKNYRLPTEAEWEFAARGGNQSKKFKYAGSNNMDEVAWYNINSGSKTHPVGQKTANELGIFDMSGNVWEWCADWRGDYISGSQTNPSGPTSGIARVNRGGGCGDSLPLCRAATRSGNRPEDRYSILGFRLARSF